MLVPGMEGMLNERVAKTKILVVGAGGIGCELLKNLVLTGFRDIEIVDLDVIDLSNLNRQFLFRRHHIGQSKARVAAEAVAKMTSDVHIVAHSANITDTKMFSLSFFMRFDLIMSALDNLGTLSTVPNNVDARRHVNNMCLSAKVPLIESGTAGYLGQTIAIVPGKSECFDCTAKEEQKTFPICTIRTTPSSPIHCIVWAKEFLLASLFGLAVKGDYPENEDERLVSSLKRECEAFESLRKMAYSNDPNYSQAVFDKVFNYDIRALLELKELWENREPPQPIECKLGALDRFDRVSADEQDIWTLNEWKSLLKQSIERLCDRAFSTGDFKAIQFDKDDDDVMDLIAAAANVRANIFGIAMISYFSLKSMAGNIIPAIATTNAIVGGMITLQALNILHGNEDRLCSSFITYGVRRGTLFARERLLSPSPSCSVCHTDRIILRLNTSRTTLRELIDKITHEYSLLLGIGIDKDIMVVEGSRILYDADMTSNEKKSLKELNCGDSKFVKFDFISSDIPLLVAIIHEEDTQDVSIEFSLLSSEQRIIKSSEDEENIQPTAKIAKIDLGPVIVDDEIIII